MSARCTRRRRRGDAEGNNLYSLVIKNKYKKKSLYRKHPVLLVFITAAKHWLGGLKFLLQHSFYRKLWCNFVTLILLALYNVLNCTCSKSAYASDESVVDWAAVQLCPFISSSILWSYPTWRGKQQWSASCALGSLPAVSSLFSFTGYPADSAWFYRRCCVCCNVFSQQT